MDERKTIPREYCCQGKEITRHTTCPCFAQRAFSLGSDRICWFCKFAAFDLFSDKLPDCGVCKHPEEQETRGNKR